jgi:hypothetical protein
LVSYWHTPWPRRRRARRRSCWAPTAGGINTITRTAPTSAPYTRTAVNNPTDGGNGLPVLAAGNDLPVEGNGDALQRSTAARTPAAC